MMEAVVENERPGPPAVRPPNEPAPLDPEQVRQFQQFQQFQELMRQNPDGPPPMLVPQPKPKPLWQRILTSRWVRRLALLALILIALVLAYDHFFPSKTDVPASISGGGRREQNVVADDNPYETVRKVYAHIAQNSPVEACNRFADDAARQQFANDFSAPDCPTAIAQLNARVDKAPGSKNAYAEPDFHGKMQEFANTDATTLTISSCDLGVTAGPRLGLFTLSRLARANQWVITAHRNETC
jgi:hypothetical protein